MQCRIYLEAKEAVLRGPRTQGATKFINKIIKWLQNNDNAFDNILIKLLIYFGYGAVGDPRGITVAWGLTRPKSGPGCMLLTHETCCIVCIITPTPNYTVERT